MAKGNSAELEKRFSALAHAKHRNEEEAIKELLSGYPLDAKAQSTVTKAAAAIVTTSRDMKEERGTLDAFLQEFGLSNKEGVALMCLAEALLRIPDSGTQDQLIAEKIKGGQWAEHMGKSDDVVVNASVWGLMLTGGVIKLDKEIGLMNILTLAIIIIYCLQSLELELVNIWVMVFH